MQETYETLNIERDKAINKDANIQKLFDFMQEMTLNYSSLLALNPDIYPDVMPKSSSDEGEALTAYRLLDLFLSLGYSPRFAPALNKKLEEMDSDAFSEIYTCLFRRVRRQFQNQITIFDRCTDYVEILTQILNYSEQMRDLFMDLKGEAAWIPGPGGINLEKGIGSCTGDILEHNSVLGPFFQPAFLPTSLTLRLDSKHQSVVDKMTAELQMAKSQQAFDKIAGNMQEKQRKYNKALS